MTPKQQDAPDVDDLMTFDDAAKYLKVTRRTIERMTKRGELAKYTMEGGGRRPPVFVDRRQVERMQRTVIAVKPEGK